jgi:hypothetical protein
MILSIHEIIDLIIMSIAVGYILMGIFRFKRRDKKEAFNWQALKFSIIVSAPALILHELGHKFVALAYGLEPTFHAAYAWLGIGIALKLLRTGFIFFIPAYVNICPTGQCNVPASAMSAIAFAGPAMNLILFLGAWILLKKGKNLSPSDGFKVYQGLWRVFF